MPELPEVETIRRQLEKEIKGKKIEEVEVGDLEVEGDIEKAKAGIKAVKRRGKILMMELDNNYSLETHFKLSGYYYYSPNKEEAEYTKVKFYLDDGSLLGFVSVRKFSWIKIKKTEEVRKEVEEKMGVEPLSQEFTLEKFKEIMEKRKRALVKTTLMKQDLIAGIGNIYSQESLYYAKIDPHRKVKTLSEEEIEELYQELKKILKRALKKRGTTAENYKDIYGREGEFWGELAVYSQEKDPQGHELKKEKIGGRGTTFCPQCQK